LTNRTGLDEIASAHQRNHYQSKHSDYRKRENLSQLFIWQGINIQNIKKLKKIPKGQTIQLLNGQINWTVFKRSTNAKKKKHVKKWATKGM
jgi:hypothetical protein